jgi:hypothetical protein
VTTGGDQGARGSAAGFAGREEFIGMVGVRDGEGTPQFNRRRPESASRLLPAHQRLTHRYASRTEFNVLPYREKPASMRVD